MSLKVAQTFYIDKSVVRGSETVTLDSIDLYFKSKPRATGNRSGIENPGVTVYVMCTKDDDIPDTNQMIKTAVARVEYAGIVASADATIKTKFSFPAPVVVKTNVAYAIGVAFDGGEEFVLWKCKEGETLVGTNTVTAGATARNVGKYFEFATDTGSTYGNWKPLNNVDLKFSVLAAKYAANVTANTVTTTYILPSEASEYVVFNRYHPNTNKYDKFKVGEMVFQETPVLYGTVTINASSTSVKANGSNINFSTLFPSPIVNPGNTLSDDPVVDEKQYIVLRNGSTQAADVDVVRVLAVISNTELKIERLPKFTQNNGTFSITPAGKLEHRDIHFHTGRWFDYTANAFAAYVGRRCDILRLSGSNANGALRFANGTVESIAINSGGTGYSNADVVTVYPVLDANTANANHVAYIPSYANATANVITNGAGTITGIAVSNTGFGLTSNVVLTITTSAGTGATLAPTVGCSLRGAVSNSMVGDCFATNMPVHRSYPEVKLLTNQHHSAKVIQHFPYYTTPGKEHILVAANPPMSREVKIASNNPTFDFDSNDGRVYVLASRSNEVKMTSNVTIKVANGANYVTRLKSSSILEVPVESNNVFTVPSIETGQVYNYSYIINNTNAGERKGDGDALARHIGEKVTFAENRNAEDIVVYCDAYRPAGTEVYVYARLHNKDDQEAFDDKDWTQLELKSNNAALTSSLTDEKDIIEFTYGLPSCPASVNTIAGAATLTMSSATVTGVGTAFNTDLKVNDVVKIYSELFPANYMITVVRTITNATSMTVDDAVSDVDLTAGNMKIDLIGRPNDGTTAEIGNPFQAFTYEPNSYICRYYNAAMSKFDTYNTFQIKIVLTSNNESIVPKVWNTRAVGVSA